MAADRLFATRRAVDFADYLRGGWNAGAHGMLQLYGIAKRWRRMPYTSLDDREIEKLADLLAAKVY